MGFIYEHRRKKILAEPFPQEWDDVLERRMKHWQLLDEDEKSRLRDLAHVFVGETHWQGCGGFELTEDVQVTIAGEASLLLLGLDGVEFTNVREVLVYPSTVKTPDAPHAQFGSIVESGPQPILGQAVQGGPVIVVWDAVQESARHPEKGHNVVYHEFAHKLDMLEGSIDGTPPLATRAELDRWIETMTAEFDRVQGRSAKGQKTFLDPYAGVNVGEFFAVATEYFFDLPVKMQRDRPALYDVLNEFYRQDPAERARRRKRSS